MKPKLSICIPVYNFSAFLGETLDSILPQVKEGVEVLVFDGGSTDSTPELMGAFQATWSNLRYHRAEARGGIDADMAKTVELALGDYVWLFSGDDLMRRGALEKALGMLSGGYDVILCKHTNCTLGMKPLNKHPVFSEDHAFVADLGNRAERLEYFRKATTTEAFFSFMGGIVVRKGKWIESGEIIKFRGSCWGHVARLFKVSQNGLTVRFVPEIWLDKRGENDSFLERGVVNRYRIAIEGYHELTKEYFGEKSEEAFHVRRALRNELKFVGFLWAKEQAKEHPEREDRHLLDQLVDLLYRDRGFASFAGRFTYHAMPVWLYRVLRVPYRRLRLLLGQRLKAC
ncbi:MAG: glycosyltransferase family 2 protein [Deltaproteobacteria bacterium]|nr:glycosyltransferase family 2 protein [Deltaproteobacteria bacterium]